MPGRLWHFDRDRARRGINPLGHIAICVALPGRTSFVMLSAEKSLALDLHGELEEPGKDGPDILCATLNQLFHQTVEHRIMPLVHYSVSIGVVTPWNTREGLPWLGIPPARARSAISDKFPDVRLQHRSNCERPGKGNRSYAAQARRPAPNCTCVALHPENGNRK